MYQEMVMLLRVKKKSTEKILPLKRKNFLFFSKREAHIPYTHAHFTTFYFWRSIIVFSTMILGFWKSQNRHSKRMECKDKSPKTRNEKVQVGKEKIR
jgi:hypothetical protein